MTMQPLSAIARHPPARQSWFFIVSVLSRLCLAFYHQAIYITKMLIADDRNGIVR
jgi:hypothetical protein